MKQFIPLFLLLFTISAFSQTTLYYPMDIDNYYATFEDGGTFNNVQYSDKVEMYGESGNKKVVAWRKFRTDASGASTCNRSLQIGDEFVVTLVARRARGRIGFALLASPSGTASWEDRESNYAISFNLDGPTYTGGGYDNWYIKYSGGNTSSASFGALENLDTYFTFTLTLTAADRMNVSIYNQSVTYNFYDVQLNTSNPITDYSIFLHDSWTGIGYSAIYWGFGDPGDQHKVTNTGSISIGNSNESFIISSIIFDGLVANSNFLPSTNHLTKEGTGTISLSAVNTYSGNTTVSAGTLILVAGNLIANNATVQSGATLSINGSPVELRNLTINNGGFLSINANKALTVNELFYIYGTCTINSDETGTGSLITGALSENIIFQRYIAAWSDAEHGWHFLSSPVATFTIDGSDFDPGIIDDLYGWAEATGLWMNHKAGDPTQIVPGTGYLTAWQATDTKDFSGALNNADIDKSNLSFTEESTNTGWHLLGNPFPCALKWGTASWSLSNIDGTAKIWNESNASFSDIDENDIIPATQAFMIHVSSGANSLTIPKDDRTHSTQAWYKEEEINKIKLTVYDPEGNTAQESIIKFNENATTGFDSEFDSYFLTGYAPQFYSVINDGIAVSTNTLPEIIEQLNIPFSFIKNSSTGFYIEAEGIDNIFPQTIVSLVDLKTNTTQNLLENPVYTFESSEGDVPGRFLIQFGVLGIEDEQPVNNLNFYIYNNKLNIVNDDLQAGTIQIFDMLGQQVLEKNYSSNENQINLNLPAAYYVIRIISGENIVNGKIHIE